MKDWTITTGGKVVKGDIVWAKGSTYYVEGIGHDEYTGGPVLEVQGGRPIVIRSDEPIQVYREIPEVEE